MTISESQLNYLNFKINIYDLQKQHALLDGQFLSKVRFEVKTNYVAVLQNLF